MAGQDAVVVQNLFHVELVEPLHVCREILDLVVGGRGGCGRACGIGLCGVHRHAAQSDQDLAVHGYSGVGVVAGVFANGDVEERCISCARDRVWRTSVDGHGGLAGFI